MMEQAIVARGKRIDQKGVWLTYDDGPNSPVTSDLLRVLDKYNAKATFFVCGDFVKNYPSIVLDVVDQGHEIANHTMTHQELTSLSREEIRSELLLTNKIIGDVTGRTPDHFRAPYSKYNKNIIEVAEELGLKNVGWTKMGMDWEEMTAKEISGLVLEHGLNDRDIVVLHDGCADTIVNSSKDFYTDRSQTVIASKYILEYIQSVNLDISNPA